MQFKLNVQGGSMRRASCVTALALVGLLAAPLAAQTRAISGTVRDSASGQPVAALVAVSGTRISVSTQDNGRFVIPNAPAGDVVLLARAVGYRRREVRVPAGQAMVEIPMVRDLFRLDAIVVSGQATGIERRRAANAIATISAEDLGSVPTASLEHQLQGKVAGADIQTNSGAPGGGVQVRLRGVTSINADAQPLYVLDGVIVSDVAIPSNQNEVTNASGGSNPALTQDAQVNRIADINPDNIESIEILKGASASAIYGGRASNGVVLITTRRGRPGAPQISLSQRFGASRLSNTLGSRHWDNAAEIDGVYGAGTAAANNFNGTNFDLERLLAHRTGFNTETYASISGGSENTRYLAAGTVQGQSGIVDNTGFQRQDLRVNLDQRIGSNMQGQVSSNFLHTRAQRGLTNNDNSTTSWYMVFPFTPSFVDLRRQPNGTFRPNTIAGSNPLQTAALMKNDEDVWRTINSARISWDLSQSLRFITVGGVDFFHQDNNLFFPPELQFEPQDGLPGTALSSSSNSLNMNLAGNLVHTYRTAGMTATTSLGVQYARRDQDVERVTSRNLNGGQPNIDAGTNVRVRQDRQLVNNLGYYLQEELQLMQERLVVTGGLRADRSSLNADASKLFFYPKLGAAYRLMRPFGFVDELKIRGAFGVAGNEPLYGQRFTALNATTSIGGLPGLVVQGSIGNADLHPERETEIELGFDVALLHDRGNLEFSVYQKSISDLLLTRALAPSSGFGVEVFNGGKLRTRGVEIALGLVPMRRGRFEWFSRVTFATTRSVVTDLPVPSFLGLGFGVGLGSFRIREGESATQIVGNDTTGGVHEEKVGDATPDFTMSFTNDVTMGAFSLHVHGQWQYGGNIINLTKLLYDFGGVTADYDVPTAGGSTVGQDRLGGWGAGQTANYIESASFFKLREVSLTYNLPVSIARRLFGGVRTASVSVAARNLFTITPYTGLDPEVSNFGNQPIGRNIDVAPFPPSRSFWFGVNLGL